MSSAWIVAYGALALLVLLLGLLVLGLMRQIVPVLESTREVLSAAAQRVIIGGLAPGSTVASFVADATDGTRFTEDDLAEEASIVLFLENDCAACGRFVRDLASGNVPRLDARLIVVSNDRSAARQLDHSGVATVLVDEARLVAQAFESAVSPQAFVVDKHRRVLAVGMPTTWDELRALVEPAKGGDHELTLAAAAVASRQAKEVV